MKTDFYTKTVLTIIALCLAILTLQNVDIIPKAHASEPNNNLGIIETKKYGLVPLNEDGSIDVNIKSFASEMDVNISSIDTKDELDINIDEIGGGYVSYGGPISVKVE